MLETAKTTNSANDAEISVAVAGGGERVVYNEHIDQIMSKCYLSLSVHKARHQAPRRHKSFPALELRIFIAKRFFINAPLLNSAAEVKKLIKSHKAMTLPHKCVPTFISEALKSLLKVTT